MKNKIAQIFLSKILHFILIRYLGFGIQFINTLLFAKYLGTFYLGVYGFLTLMIQYLNYLNLGTQYSLNYFLSVKKSSMIKKSIYSNALFINILIIFTLILLFSLFSLFKINLFNKYNVNNFYLLVVFIASAQILNQLFINIFRTYGILWQINISFLIIPLIQVFGVFFFEGQELLYYLLWAILLGNFVSLVIFFIYCPFDNFPKFNLTVSKSILTKGINLLIYNMSFYLIMLSGKTLVGIFYSVENMGQYSFGSNLSNAVMMVLGSVSFLFFSKMVNRLASFKDVINSLSYIEKSRKVYFNLTMIIVLFFFVIIPYLNWMFIDYSKAFKVCQILLIAQIIIANSFGFSTLLIAKNKEKYLTKIGIITVALNLFLSIFIIFYNFPFHFIAYSTLISVFFYNVYIVKQGFIYTNQESNFIHVFKYLFPVKFIIVIIFMLISVVLDLYYMGFLAILYYLIFSYKEIMVVVYLGIGIIVKEKNLNL